MSKEEAREVFAEGWSALQIQLGGLLTFHGITDTRPAYEKRFEEWWDGCRFTPEAEMIKEVFKDE